MNSKKSGMHYAWKILISCCLINMSALGVTNTNGLFYNAVSSDLGILMSKLLIHTVFQGAASALTLLAVDKVYKKYPLKMILLVSSLLFNVSQMVMAAFSHVWQFCAAGVVCGIGAAFLFYVPVPMLLNNWFVKKKKTALSVCFVASGLSGIILSLAMGGVINSFGWRTAYIARGAVSLLLIIPVMIFAVKKPEELGLTAYGSDQNAAGTEKHMGASAGRHSFEEKRKKFVFAVAVAVLCNLTCGMTGMLPHFAGTLGYGVLIGSYLTSLAMVGNIGSKALMGPMTEKYGIVVTGSVCTAVLTFGFLLMGLGITAMPAVLFSSVTTGFSACLNTLIIPNLVDTFVKGDEYVHVLSICSTGTMIASSLSYLFVSLLVDNLGYGPSFLIYSTFGILIAVILRVVYKQRKAVDR